MAEYTFPQRVQSRGYTELEWSAKGNDIPKAREICVVTDKGRLKVGDGSTPFADLPFVGYGNADLTNLSNGSILAYNSTLGYFVPTFGATDGDKGDIIVSSNGTVWEIDAGAVGTTELANDAVTNAKLANMAASTIKARKTASTGDPEDCTLSEVLDLIGSAAQGDILYRGSSGWARLPSSTSGYVLQTNGPSANPSWVPTSGGGGSAFNPATTFEVMEDFVGAYPFAYATDWKNDSSTGGSASSFTTTVYPGHPGVIQVITGPNTTGLGIATDAGSNYLALGGGVYTLMSCMMMPNLSNGTDRFSLSLGLSDVGTGAPNNRLELVYSDNINSGNWVIRTRVAAGSTTDVNGSFGPPAGGTWFIVKLVVNAAGNSAEYFVDSGSGFVSVGTTTNVPTVGLRRRWVMSKSAGTTNRSLLVDYAHHKITLTTTR